MAYRLPNGFGSVYKLSGNRRKPWAARKTVGWKDSGQPIYAFVGYYSSRTEALTALSDFNKDPYDLQIGTITFEQLYTRWSDEHFKKISHSGVISYDRIELAVPKGMKQVITSLAKDKGMSVSSYVQDLVRRDQEGMLDTMQIAGKHRTMLSGIRGNMHDGYDITFKDGTSLHCRTKLEVRKSIIRHLTEDSESLTEDP